MNAIKAILTKIIVKTWYNQQAGFFFFIFLVFFGAVAPSMQLAYHYTLIKGMLEVPVFMLVVLLAWLTPDPIRIRDSWCFLLSGYSVLLLLYMSAATVAMGDYLKLCLALFGILYACVLGDLLIGMSGLFLVTAVLLFRWGY